MGRFSVNESFIYFFLKLSAQHVDDTIKIIEISSLFSKFVLHKQDISKLKNHFEMITGILTSEKTILIKVNISV